DGARRVPEAGRVRAALAGLWATLRSVARMGAVGRFLLAHMLYADGLVTLFAMGGVYVSGVYGFSLPQVMLFGIVLNVTAGIGAAGFAWVDDRVGSKPTILVALAGLLGAGAAILLVEDAGWVWVSGAVLGAFVGPAQAASRSYMARIAPPDSRTELFGLYALAGKATAFLGPWLVGIVTAASGSQRAGMAVILGFFLAGAAVLATVRGDRP
ncbi:MAG: MFS transporter, partial [Pseudomonadota bacterium]